ncbi:hypothetical protein [Streptomyces sp. NPDC001604]|uniref:hypothetical protein n=1 Tax=Streptomyces sp. NPDC001604 TaxID=3364593 RepID=UPI0036B24EC5
MYGFFQRWRASGDLARIHAELHQLVRVHDGLNPRTVAVILDSQSVKGSETVGQDSKGFDGGTAVRLATGAFEKFTRRSATAIA